MVRSLARQPSSLAAFAMAMALPLMTMGLRAVLCMRACARLNCASEGGFVGGRSRRALLRGRVLMRGAVLWAWLFGGRMVAPDFVLGFRRHCHFGTRAIAYSLALSLSKKYKNGFRGGTPEKFEAAVKAGSILKADTIEDLADQMRVDKDTLVATVARYNELVDKGVDEDFGMASEYFVLSPIKQAPFYAIERIPSVLATCGGLRCTDELKVLDNDDNVISGLWVAGNVQGSMFGYDYPVTGFQGLSLGRALTGGILAVKSMVGTFDEAI